MDNPGVEDGVVGHYWVEDGFVVMCRANGAAIELNGKRFRRKFGTTSGEPNEREVAGMMTREIRLELKQGPYSRITGLVVQFPTLRGSERGLPYR